VLGAATLAATVALAGCTGSSPSGVAATSESSAPGATSSPSSGSDGSGSAADAGSADLHYPDGASADTADCQKASAAVISAVNATIVNPLPGGASSVASLTAHPDPEHAVWLLTGAIASTPGAEGYLVSWATTGDPTRDAFEGNLRSVGSVTATLSSAPVLQFPDAAVGGLPASALECAAALPRDSSQ
jgi:hypothetical protein